MSMVIDLASRRAAPAQSGGSAKPQQEQGRFFRHIERQAAIENSLSMALHHVRDQGNDVANLHKAVGRANRALTLLKQACDEAVAADLLRGR